MIFEWPLMLWMLAVVPVLVALYVLVVDRKRVAAAQQGLWSGRAPAPRAKRLTPPLLFMAAIALLIVAAARPVAVLPLPSLHGTVVLAMDVSNSMLADDLDPTRLAAAQNAAREFIEAQPASTQIGIVAFAETALPVQRPSQNREELLKSIDRLKPQEGTALGSAILVSLQTLFPKEQFEVRPSDENKDEAKPIDAVGPAPATRAPGSETSAAIILLTDGQATGGPNPIEAAKKAADRGVRVYTIGIGTPAGAVVKLQGMSMRVQMDEKTLKEIADLTLSRYYAAENAEDLSDVYREITSRLRTETREHEITSFFIAAAAALALIGATLSMAWFNRIL